MRGYSLPLGDEDAIGFKRLTDDEDIYNWWSGGSAGVMLVQSQPFAIAGDTAYLDDLRRTADGLVVLADPAGPAGVNWTTRSGVDVYRPVVFSHGNGSIAPALLLAREHLGDADYLAPAKASIDWLEAVARPGEGGGVYWEHSIGSAYPNLRTTGAFVGTASVGWMFARMYGFAGEPRLRDLALRGADHLLAVAERLPEGRRRWPNYPGPEDADWEELLYKLGWYDGNAGIGMFLVAAHELANGLRPRADVHLP